MKKIYKNQFKIESRRTGNRLRGCENQVMYEVFTADGTKKVKSGFYRRKDADKWLSQTINTANKMLAGEIQTN